MLDTEVVANDAVDAGTAVIELLVGENDEDGVLPLLTPYQDGVTSEKLERVHGSLGQGNDAVVIVDGIGDPMTALDGPDKPKRGSRSPTSAGWASSSS